MCLAFVLAPVLLPLGGAIIGGTVFSQTGAWIGGAIGSVASLVLVGVPSALYLKAEKRKYDSENNGYTQ